MYVLNNLECPENRLEEIAMNYRTFGELSFHSYTKQIDSITVSDINRAAREMFVGKPTLVVTGDAINLVPNVTDVAK